MASQRTELATAEVQRDLFDYGNIPAADLKRCESAIEKITKHQRNMAGGIIAIGNELIAVKERLDHGQFGQWIEHYLGWSHKTCCNYMNVASVFGKIENFSILTIDTTALHLLSSDNCPDEVRDEFIERAEKGEHITHASVKHELTGEKDEPTYEDRIDRIITKIRSLSDCEQRPILLARLRNLCLELEENE